MEKIIEVSGLTKKYGKLKAVDDLSLTVGKGEIFGLLGPTMVKSSRRELVGN